MKRKKQQWSLGLLMCFVVFCAACGSLESDSAEIAATQARVDPLKTMFSSCQNQVQEVSSGRFSVVGCAAAGASGSALEGGSATVMNPLQATGSTILGD